MSKHEDLTAFKKKFAKIDLKDYGGKLPAASMHWEAFREIGRVFTYAQKKYGNVDSWRNIDESSYTRYKDALARHYLDFMAGEETDIESGLPQLLLIAWNVLTLITIKLKYSTARLMRDTK